MTKHEAPGTPTRCGGCGLRWIPGHLCPATPEAISDQLEDLARGLAPQLVVATHDQDLERIEDIINGLTLTEMTAVAITLAAAADPWRTVCDGLRWLDPHSLPEWTPEEQAEHAAALTGVSLHDFTGTKPTDDEDIDYVLVERVCAGKWRDTAGARIPLNRLEQAEAAAYMLGHHVPQLAILERLGISIRTLNALTATVAA